ncbi:Hsp20 family protein [Scytonema sp. UIC 10036]|uniref:Hsp20/alpha crystallin family protein n=1 Tax=Scytonema sp. UIC 10036 TaxID=2304196 RepID=UPI0012DA8F39|nr:Hsp20/alpha crystallin family protein [Scytonema sp. UIC 10036]MUH00890.1 Hsp20 family protein [Scytonema sp. UIC 10036]
MTLIRYNPWQELNAIQRLFEETRVPFERDFVKVPAAELTQTDDAVYLKLELPGMDAKDLDIQVTENTISISGERKSETKNEDKGMTRTEFHYGKFQRVIPLPVKVQNTDVTAEYKDGILNLTLPKKEEEKNKVVKVNLEQPAA